MTVDTASTEKSPEAPTAPQAPAAPAGTGGRRRGSFWREFPVLIVIAFAIALLIKSFLIQAFYIPSASMEPTLQIGDRVIVEKLSYRFGEPERFDVVVFEKDIEQVVDPTAPSVDEPVWRDVLDAFRGLFGFPTGDSRDFIKRVIGVGGDTVEGRDGRVYVNGRPIEEPYLPRGTTTADFPETEVEPGAIFVMGDNRGNSDDSRNFGPVPVDSVIGRGLVLIWPPADFRGL